MSSTDASSKSKAPPPTPFIDPTAEPHIYQQILEDPAIYWNLHDLRVVSRAFADMIDGIQCTHLVVQMTEPGTITRKSYWDEVKMLAAHGGEMRVPGEEVCVDIEASAEYLVQRRIILDDIICAIRGLHIPALWPLWEDEWDSDRRKRALDLVRRNTATVEFVIHRPPGQPWAPYQYRYVGPDAVFAPDGVLRQVVHALSGSVGAVRGDQNWVVDTITSRSVGREGNVDDYKRQHLPNTAMVFRAINGFWREGQWENRRPMFLRALNMSVQYNFHIHYSEPDNKGHKPGILDKLVETMAQRLWAPWTVIVADQGVLEQAWIGRYSPHVAVRWRLQEAVIDWVRDVGRRVSPEHFRYSPAVFEARARAIAVINPVEYRRQVSAQTQSEVVNVHHWWPVSVGDRYEIEKGKCKREFERRRRFRVEAAATAFASMEAVQ